MFQADTCFVLSDITIDDSTRSVEKLELQLARDRQELTGETESEIQAEDAEDCDNNSEISFCGSDDSLHKKGLCLALKSLIL